MLKRISINPNFWPAVYKGYINNFLKLGVYLNPLKSVLISMRPHQWYKNFVIFICILFSRNFFNIEMWGTLFLVFIVFCMLAGSQYMFNDIKDLEKDRLHPKKKFRPIASNLLPKRMAIVISVSIMLLSLLLALRISRLVTLAGLMYLVNSLVYSFYLKRYAIVDAIVISIGFVIRAIAGCFAINVVISPWLILCVFLLALVLAFGKRRKELLVAKESRASLSQYTIQMSDSLLNLSVSMFLMSYALYTVSVNSAMMITLPFAFFGVFRYVQLVHLKGFGEETELILMDKSFIANFTLWILVIIFVLYGGMI